MPILLAGKGSQTEFLLPAAVTVFKECPVRKTRKEQLGLAEESKMLPRFFGTSAASQKPSKDRGRLVNIVHMGSPVHQPAVSGFNPPFHFDLAGLRVETRDSDTNLRVAGTFQEERLTGRFSGAVFQAGNYGSAGLPCLGMMLAKEWLSASQSCSSFSYAPSPFPKNSKADDRHLQKPADSHA